MEISKTPEPWAVGQTGQAGQLPAIKTPPPPPPAETPLLPQDQTLFSKLTDKIKLPEPPAELLYCGIINDGTRMRAREVGIKIGDYSPGKYNAITDVKGVKIGHVTRRSGSGPLVPGTGPVRTGVTAIVPSPDYWNNHIYAGSYVLNGNGELTGLALLQETGLLNVPIMLTNTLNVGKVCDGVVEYLIKKHPQIGLAQDVPIPVVAECDDSTLNDIQGRHVTKGDVAKALDQATSGPLEEGSVGAGTGMICYHFKGGIGTSSRVLPKDKGGYTVGVMVLTNQGERRDLLVDGVPVGKEVPEKAIKRRNDGSIIGVIATDAPLSPEQLNRLAKRASLALARTGSKADMGSGDIFLAFSTANKIPLETEGFTYPVKFLSDLHIDPVMRATQEATEEAILNSLLMAKTTEGPQGVTAYALPIHRLKDVMKKYNHPLD